MADHIKPAATKAEFAKHVHWHVFLVRDGMVQGIVLTEDLRAIGRAAL
jgi:hypothetical protein